MDGILQKKNKAFISWSGNKARTCADFLSDLLNKIFEENEIVFCSRHSLRVIVFSPLLFIKSIHCTTWKLFLRRIPMVAFGSCFRIFLIEDRTKFFSSSALSKILAITASGDSGLRPSTGCMNILKNAFFIS